MTKTIQFHWEKRFVLQSLEEDEIAEELLEPEKLGKVSAQPHTIVKQICFPNGNVLFLSLFSLLKN